MDALDLRIGTALSAIRTKSPPVGIWYFFPGYMQ